MAVPVVINKVLTAASANAIALSQTPGAAGNLTINGASASGGVATLDTLRRVIITSVGNDSARTFTVYGTGQSGQTIQESVTGGNATAVSTVNDFLTVTRVAVDAATAGAVTVGTNTVGSTRWVNPTWHIAPTLLQVETSLTGAVTYNLEYTLSDYYTPTPGTGAPPTPVIVRSTPIVGATTGMSYTFTFPIRGWRLTVTAGTGTLVAESVQAGIGSEAA